MRIKPAKYQAFTAALCAILSSLSTQAAAVFPIADSSTVVQVCGGLAFDGTNFLAAVQAGTESGAQLISPAGALVGPFIKAGAGFSFPPALAAAFGDGVFLEIWSDTTVKSGVDIYGQRISAAGAKVGASFPLLSSVGSHGFQTVCALCFGGTNFLAVWQDGANGYFYGQIITAAGGLSGPEFLISDQQENGIWAWTASDGTNFLAAWQSNTNAAGQGGQPDAIYGELISSAGAAGSPFQISQTISSDEDHPGAAAFDGTNYFVVWDTDTLLNLGGNGLDRTLYGRFVSPGGALSSGEVKLAGSPGEPSSGNQTFPNVAFDGRNYLLAWSSYTNSASASGDNLNLAVSRGQLFDRSANAVGSAFTPLPLMGSNHPLFALNGLVYGGSQFMLAGTYGSIIFNADGDGEGFASGQAWGTFISENGTPGIFTPVTITTESSPLKIATLTGGGPYTSDSVVTVAATVTNDCYYFTNWTVAGKAVTTDSTYTFTAVKSETLTANFLPFLYKVQTASAPANGGITTGGGSKDCGASVKVTARANSGFRFLYWSQDGQLVTTNLTYPFTASSSVLLTANFLNTKPPTLTVTSPAGAATKTTNSAVTLEGEASDNVAVTNIYFSVSGSAWTSARTGNNWTNWTASVPLAVGTNNIEIFAVDSTGLDSTPRTVVVVREFVPDTAPFAIDATSEPHVHCAFDGSNYLVVYNSSGNFAQFVSPSGQLLGGPLGLNGGGDPPTVAFDGTNYLTAWVGYLGGAAGVAATIDGAFVGPGGAVGQPDQLVKSTTVDACGTLVYGGGVYFVMWSDSGGTSDNTYVYGAMISPSGGEAVSDFQISPAGAQNEYGQGEAAFDGTNFLATWSGTKGGSSINGRLISPAGNFVTDPFVIYTNSASAIKQVTCATFDGTRYLVLFSVITSLQAPTTWHIQGRIVTTSGQVMDKEINLTTDTGPQAVPGGAFDGTNYLLTWSQGFDPYSTASSGDSVKAGFFDVNGDPIAGEFTLFAPQDGQGAMWAPVLFDGVRFFSVAALGKIAQPAPNLDLANGMIYGTFIVP